jgi:5,10-methylenetetrahydromethanopterin reductase
MKLSCAFATSLDSPGHAVIAEELGYERVWLYDTPQQGPDVWMALALAAERTSRIGLGPGVLVPSLRHPMVNAAATASLQALAPGRVAVAFGTGFTGRRAMGYGAIPWSYMTDYIRAYRGLLRGETVEWEGARMRMLHPDGFVAERPIDVPIVVAALGPKGAAVAKELGDGLYVTSAIPDFATEFEWVSYLFWGTVREDGEDTSSERVRAAGGPGWALAYHAAHEFGGEVGELPGGAEWKAVIERSSSDERHLAVHDRHCVALNAADHAAWEAGGHAILDDVTVSGSPSQVAERVAALADVGVTDVVFQPSGPDIRRELEAFRDAVTEVVQ